MGPGEKAVLRKEGFLEPNALEGRVRQGRWSHCWICNYRGHHDLDKNRVSGGVARSQPAMADQRGK